MKAHVRNEGGMVLVLTLCFTVIAALSAGAFLHLTKTQIAQVRSQAHSTKAFYAAEAGLERAMKILKDDLYYTPEGQEPSWADGRLYDASGYVHLLIQKYMNPNSANYNEDFYPVVAETDYDMEGNGRYKSTYRVDFSNLAGWTDRIWVKTTGRFYRRNQAADGYVLEAERRVLALVRAREISPWNNAIFAGEGASGRVINGNVDIRGSVHLLGTSLSSGDFAAEFSGSGNVKNNYAGIPSELGSRIPSIAKDYGGEIVDSLEAEVRIQHGKLALSGSSVAGEADVPGNGVKETVEGVYITDGYGGNSGEGNVHSDNGTGNPYDLDEFQIRFPRLSEPYKSYSTYLDYLRANALVISDAGALSKLKDIKPTSLFFYGNERGQISMDGLGHLTIRGIVVVEGDVKFNRDGDRKTIEYVGKGVLTSNHNVFIDCHLLTSSFGTYPETDILGVMAADKIEFDYAQLNVMGVFYAENQIVSKKQTSVAGTFFSNYFDMGQNVPAVYQVPDVVECLPEGMIGDFRIWTVKRITWNEI